MPYNHTKSRVLQWLGIILIIGVFGGAYWYFQVYGSTLNQSQNDLNTTNLVGLWSFNGDDISGTTAYDRSGSGNNGTLTNGPAKTLGKIGQALNFFPNGSDTNAYVTMGDPGSGALDFGSGDFSVGFWMKGQGYNNQTSSVNVAVSKKNNDVAGSAGYLFYYTSSNLMVFRLGNGTTDYEVTAPTTTVNDNQWHRYTGLRSGSTIYLYIDGSLVGSTGSASGSVSNGDPFLVGGDLTNTRNVNGSIEEVRVYNVALTADQIRSTYVQGNGTKVNTSISNPQGTGRLDSGLAGYWAMDNGSGTSATDSSTNGNTGTLTNGPTWTTGQVGGAVTFDGTDDYITITPTAAIKPQALMTLSAWVKRTASGEVDYIFYERDTVLQEEGIFFYIGTDNKVHSVFRITGGGYVDVLSTTTITDTSWHMVTASLGAANLMTFYIDGVFAGSGTPTTPNTGLTISWAFIGARYASGSPDFFGSLSVDEMRFYNRTLSADEVSQLYRLTTPTAVDTGLKIYYSFDGQDTSGTTTYDRSGVGNTGTLTNGPTKTAGRVGQALSFDGSNDYVDTATNTVYNGQFTVAIWFLTNNNSQTGMIFGDSTGSAGGGIKTGIVSGNFFVRPVSSSDTSIPVPAAGQWHHIVMTRNSSDKIDFYLDGGDAKRLFSDVAQGGSFTPDKLGCNGSTPDQCFTGKLDEFRSYNRALTGAEVKSLYAAGEVDKMNSSLSQPQGTGRLDSALAAYFPLDENTGTTTTDGSTNGATGTLTNGPAWTTGQIGYGIDFDGTDDYVTVPDADTLNIVDGHNFTLSGWFNRDTFTTDDTILAKSNGQAASDTGYNVYIDDTTDKVTFVANDGTDQYKLESVSTFTATGWHHYSIVWDDSGSTQTKLYIDGAYESATATGTFANVNSLANAVTFRLGAESDAGNPFDGKLDEARLYRRALSGDEVTQLYRLTTPMGVDTSLKGYWSFNGPDVSGTTAFDRSGAGNTGTLTNGPTKAIGKIGQGLSFDDTDDYVSVADNAALDVTDTDDLTLTGWFYRNATGNADVFFAKRNGVLAAQTGYIAYIASGTNKIVFELSDGTDEYSLDSTSTFTTTANPGWNHFAVVWDENSAANSEIYVNGVADSATDTGTIANIGDVSNALILALGAQSDGATPFNGRLDEMRLYKRALSAAEIATLYNQGR